jgi:hypothetical protein
MIWNEEKLKKLSKEQRANIESVIKKYGDNKWWQSNDLIEIAKYQLFEKVLMVDFSKFHEGVEILLGRPVLTHEFGLNIEGLREEAKIAISKLGNDESLETSQEYKKEMVSKSIEQLKDFCIKEKKDMIIITSDR